MQYFPQLFCFSLLKRAHQTRARVINMWLYFSIHTKLYNWAENIARYRLILRFDFPSYYNEENWYNALYIETHYSVIISGSPLWRGKTHIQNSRAFIPLLYIQEGRAKRRAFKICAHYYTSSYIQEGRARLFWKLFIIVYKSSHSRKRNSTIILTRTCARKISWNISKTENHKPENLFMKNKASSFYEIYASRRARVSNRFIYCFHTRGEL